MLPKVLRVKKSEDFQKIFQTGKSIKDKDIICRYLPNSLNHHRAGFALSKKLKLNAVQRNRLKRQLSASFKEVMKAYQSTSSGFDFIFIMARLPKKEEKRYNVFTKNLENIISKIISNQT